MAAGLGFKTFAVGEVLTAADTNGYLMQGVLVFASAAARDAAITSPQEGQFAYLKDTNVTTYYTGSAWANLDTTGMTNPMTTTGDMVYSSSGSTPARLGIGSTGNVLTVAGGVPTWAAPAGGGGANYTLLNAGGTTLSGTSTTISGISGKEKFMVFIEDASNGSSQTVGLRINGDSGAKYNLFGKYMQVDTSYTPAAIMQRTGFLAQSGFYLGGIASADASKLNAAIAIDGGTTTGGKSMQSIVGVSRSTGNQNYSYDTGGIYEGSAVITSITVEGFGSSFISGKVYVWASA